MNTMLKLTAMVLLISLHLAESNAQMTDGVRFGLKLGVNGTNLYDDAQASDKKSRIGVTGGAFVQIPFAKGRMALRPELLFATKGANYTFSNVVKSEIKFSYAELPVSLEYRLFGLVNLHAGAYAAWLANGEGKFEGVANFPRDSFERFDYGWHAGTGIDFGNLGLHFRLNRGLKGVRADTTLEELVGKLKNSAWTLTLSYGF